MVLDQLMCGIVDCKLCLDLANHSLGSCGPKEAALLTLCDVLGRDMVGQMGSESVRLNEI